MLFGVVATEHKDSEATQTSDRSSHLHRAVIELKAAFGDELVVMTDVAFAPPRITGIAVWFTKVNL